MTYELHLRHLDRSGNLKNAYIEPLWVRYTQSVNGQEPLVFALNVEHGAVESIEEFDVFEVRLRNRELGIVDFEQAFVSVLRDWDIETDDDGLTFVKYVAPNEKHILSWRSVLWYAGVNNRSDFRNVKAETLMKTLIQYNFTPDASTANGRQRDGDLLTGMGIDISIAADQARGENVTAAFMGGNILSILQRVANQGGGDFSLAWQGGNEWLFDFHPGQFGADKSSGPDRVLFSLATRTMSSPRLRRTGAKATAAISGGQNVGEIREVTEVVGPDYAADYDIETFVDARNEKSEDGRIFRGKLRLDELRAQEELSFGVLQTSNQFYSPVDVPKRKTYRAGDLALAVYGIERVVKIEAVKVEWNVPTSREAFQVDVTTREVIDGRS